MIEDDLSRNAKIISTKKYNFLKAFFNTLTEEELKELEKYEQQKKKELEEKIKSHNKLYRESLKAKKRKKIKSIPVQIMKKYFVKYWEQYSNKKFEIRNDHEKEFYNVICRYFANDKLIQGKSFEFAPFSPIDLKKDLLILGGYGVGKTSMMMAFHEIGKYIAIKYGDLYLWFIPSNCIEMITEFESESTDRGEFIDHYIKAHRYFDDLGRERNASKFGKINLMAELLEIRLNDKTKRTFITSNLTAKEYETKYGGAVWSRTKERMNILIYQGNDRRK